MAIPAASLPMPFRGRVSPSGGAGGYFTPKWTLSDLVVTGET